MSDKKDDAQTTHFGFQSVNVKDKARKVADVFHSVANRYDVMNDLMSLGIHRIWKKITVEFVRPQPGNRILDLAGGTGDLAMQMAPRVGDKGLVVLADINASMLGVGRDRLVDHGIFKNVQFVQADAQFLPFPDNYFDCVTIAFGLRNVTHKEWALKSMCRVLKPGGKALVLEFSKPTLPGLSKVYDWYSFNVLPRIGKVVANDEASYRYLAESIRMHPDQQTLLQMMRDAGFSRVDYYNFTGGIVALHRGYKF